MSPGTSAALGAHALAYRQKPLEDATPHSAEGRGDPSAAAARW